MTPVVLVPRRADGGWRDQLWAYCRPRWEALGWPIIEGHHDDGPFNRARAINQAAAEQPWDVALIVDADVTIPAHNADQAGWLAANTGKLVFAYDRRRNLNRQATMRLLYGWPITIDPRPAPNAHVQTDLKLWPLSPSCSSALTVTRELFEAVGGYDERFEGWGWEDVAFHRSALTVTGHGHEAVEGDLMHLWHPRPVERIHKDDRFLANKELGQRYKDALGDMDAIRSLIAERPHWPLCGHESDARADLVCPDPGIRTGAQDV